MPAALPSRANIFLNAAAVSGLTRSEVKMKGDLAKCDYSAAK
jgi:hypothetical protein